MKVDAFDFELPAARIADRPARPRDRARLLVVEPDRLADRTVTELPMLLRPGDLLVVNDTLVIPARLTGRRGAAAVEITLLERADEAVWTALARPARRLRPGDRIDFAPEFSADVTSKGPAGAVTLRFDTAGRPFLEVLARHGVMPLPPYIARRRPVDRRDRADYQTIFAARAGAIAAPTAGLHFTPSLLDRLAAAGIGRATVTLHVGAGTFLPVKTADTDDHVMQREWGRIDQASAAAVEATRAAGGRVVAVGSTALRLLEAAATADGWVRPFTGATDLFITPGYRFRVVDLLVTNFHLPRSTLFMLVAAFAGLEPMRAAYAHAIARRYRFYSYGDACLLYPKSG